LASVTADNASNVLAAFDVVPTSSKEQSELSDGEDEWEWEFDLDSSIDENDGFDLNQLCPKNSYRNSCLAHLMQLAIKDAIRSSELVKGVTAKLSSIVSYFNNSPKRHTELMNLTGGLKLIKPCATRWNSLHNSMHRVMRVVSKDDEEVKKKEKRNIHEC